MSDISKLDDKFKAENLNDNVFASPESENSRLVPDNVTMQLGDLTLRPGTHHRYSFRGTSGCSVEVIVRAHEWLTLDILNASRSLRFAEDASSPTEPTSPVVGPVLSKNIVSTSISTGTSNEKSKAVPPLVFITPTKTIDVATNDKKAATGIATALRNTRRRTRPQFPGDSIFDPINDFESLPPSIKPTLPVDVIVGFRNGDQIRRVTLHADSDNLSPSRMLVEGIEGNDIIDVTFVNPNNVGIICQTCIVRVERQVRTEVITLQNAMFLRAFNGALRSFIPTASVEDGKAIIRFKGELAKELGIETITKDLPISFNGGVTFKPGKIEIMGQHELVQQVLVLFQSDVAKFFGSIVTEVSERNKLSGHRDSIILSNNFIQALHTEYFEEQPKVREKVLMLATPDGLTTTTRNLLLEGLNALINRYTLLTNLNPHQWADLAMSASYKLTELHGNAGSISIELDEIQASAYIVFNQISQPQPAPHADLPYDRLSVGTLRPTIHFKLDISDFDVDIDVPLWLDIVSAGTITLSALILEQGGEALLDAIANKIEELLPIAVHSAIESHVAEYGDLLAETFTRIANRDHVFHRVAANRSEIAIATIDPNQLKIPHDPNYNRRPSPTSGIAETVDSIRPIDHDLTAPLVAQGLSPEARLQNIKHLVFIMMENRSFDHMLGYLSHPEHGARTDVEGLDGSSRILGGDLTGTIATPLRGPNREFSPNLPHDHKSIVKQINEGAMDGFASEYAIKLAKTVSVNKKGFNNDPERVLRFQTPDFVETYNDLAKNFAVCDYWFSSVPAGTYPNRSCYYSGVTPSLTNDDIIDEFGYLDELTLFDVLDHVGVDWKVFESDVTFLRVFDRYRLEQERIRPLAELDELTGSLPPVTFIDPNFTGFPSDKDNNDDQPPTDTLLGQAFIGNIVNKIKSLSEWESTMIVITYDEHGGFADHVPPPGAPGSSHPPVNGISPISLSHPKASTYGVRVPAFVVSPHVEPGSVAHNIFDHSAVFRTVLQRFAPQFINSAIIPERVRRSRHLGEVLSAHPPRVFTEAITTPSPNELAPKGLRISRIVDRELEDKEDLSFALGQLGKPTPKSRR